mmetsp:Transcript_64943/g.193577  ORF Transcript_64943/g.193577 Transcript_64943/m.193577 type:complete len:531 (+) Transcript_64943:36-1628(+)
MRERARAVVRRCAQAHALPVGSLAGYLHLAVDPRQLQVHLPEAGLVGHPRSQHRLLRPELRSLRLGLLTLQCQPGPVLAEPLDVLLVAGVDAAGGRVRGDAVEAPRPGADPPGRRDADELGDEAQRPGGQALGTLVPASGEHHDVHRDADQVLQQPHAAPPPRSNLQGATHGQERQLEAEQRPDGIQHLGPTVEALEGGPARQVARVAPAPATRRAEHVLPLRKVWLQPVHRKGEPRWAEAVNKLDVVLAGSDHVRPPPAAPRADVGVGAHPGPARRGHWRIHEHGRAVLVAVRIAVALALRADSLARERAGARLVQQPDAPQEIGDDVGQRPPSQLHLWGEGEAEGGVQTAGEERRGERGDPEEPDQAQQLAVLLPAPGRFEVNAQGRIGRAIVLEEAAERHGVEHVQQECAHEGRAFGGSRDEWRALPDEGHGRDGGPCQEVAEGPDQLLAWPAQSVSVDQAAGVGRPVGLGGAVAGRRGRVVPRAVAVRAVDERLGDHADLGRGAVHRVLERDVHRELEGRAQHVEG